MAVRILIDRNVEEEGGGDTADAGDEGGHGGRFRTGDPAAALPQLPLGRDRHHGLDDQPFTDGRRYRPLFAGAGVIGLAIGFGAQTLIKDIFSGAFFLMDDAFRGSEYIDIGSVKGTVEKISVRSMQLRHQLGTLVTVPFGEIQHLSNYSRDWVIMKLTLRLTYNTT